MRRNGALAEIHPFILGQRAPLGRDGVGFPLSQEEQGFTPVVGRVEAEEGGGQRSLGSGAGYGGEDLPWAMGMRGQLWLG